MESLKEQLERHNKELHEFLTRDDLTKEEEKLLKDKIKINEKYIKKY